LSVVRCPKGAPAARPSSRKARAGRRSNAKAYWSATLRLLTKVLIVWFLVSFGAASCLRPHSTTSVWVATRSGSGSPAGSIYTFIACIFYYAKKMGEIDRQFDVHED
jgi:putative solute:sodium symporter small subunit